MDLPKPYRNESHESYWRRISRENMPKGAGKQVKTKHSPKQGCNGRAVSFSIEGDCKGPLSQVMELGHRMAQAASDVEDIDLAIKILDRVENLPYEYELKMKIASLKALQTQLKKAG